MARATRLYCPWYILPGRRLIWEDNWDNIISCSTASGCLVQLFCVCVTFKKKKKKNNPLSKISDYMCKDLEQNECLNVRMPRSHLAQSFFPYQMEGGCLQRRRNRAIKNAFPQILPQPSVVFVLVYLQTDSFWQCGNNQRIWVFFLFQMLIQSPQPLQTSCTYNIFWQEIKKFCALHKEPPLNWFVWT